MTDEEIGKVNRWLNSETGYPLEYSAVRILEAARFVVDHGRYYVAPGGTAREIDVVARAPGGIDASGPDGLSQPTYLVCECKVLPTPWVVLTRSRPIGPKELLGWLIAGAGVQETLTERADRAIRSQGSVASAGFPRWLTDTPDPHASGLIAKPRSGAGGESENPHKALAQVIDAARGFVEPLTREPVLAWPVLIVRGSLYEAAPAADGGALEARPIGWQRLVWGGANAIPTVVDIVREQELPAYAERARDGLDAIAAALRIGLSGA